MRLRKPTMKIGVGVLGLSICLVFFAWVYFSSPLSVPTLCERSCTPLLETLSDRRIWGPDFERILPLLAAWRSIGEDKVTVFPWGIEGYNHYDFPQAQIEAGALDLDLFKRLDWIAPIRVEPVLRGSDGYSHVMWAGLVSELFSETLTIDEVTKVLGPPESVRYGIVIEGNFENRPPVLSEYSYFAGAMVFVESDFHAGIVDRVLLDIQGVDAALLH